MITDVVMIKPGIAQALELLGKWVVCRLQWEGEEAWSSGPCQVVGVVVPAPGSAVGAQLLVDETPWIPVLEGYSSEIFLDSIKHLRIVEPLSCEPELAPSQLGG